LKEPDNKTQKKLAELQQEYLPRLEKYENQLETLEDRNSYSKTDTDATFMRMKEDHMKNGQLNNSGLQSPNQHGESVHHPFWHPSNPGRHNNPEIPPGKLWATSPDPKQSGGCPCGIWERRKL
jgi:hypothetical protein